MVTNQIKNRLYILNLKTGDRTYATSEFDQNTGSISWTADNKNIYFTSDWHGAFQIYKYNLKSGSIDQITEGLHDYRSVTIAGKHLVATKQTMAMPTELFSG